VKIYMPGFQPLGSVVVLTQGFALGWYIVAPLALRVVACRGELWESERNTEALRLRCAHDNKVVVGLRKRSSVARYPTLCKERKG